MATMNIQYVCSDSFQEVWQTSKVFEHPYATRWKVRRSHLEIMNRDYIAMLLACLEITNGLMVIQLTSLKQTAYIPLYVCLSKQKLIFIVSVFSKIGSSSLWERKLIFTLAGQSEAVNRKQSVITAEIHFHFEPVHLLVKLLQVTSLCHTESLEGIQ